MDQKILEIETNLLQLPVESRTYLAERLWESLEAEPDPEIEAAWAHEIGKRIRDIDKGRVTLIPAETVFREARKKLNEARRLSS